LSITPGGLLGRARLGLIAGAFFISASHVAYSQVVPPPASEVPIPPKPPADSAAPKPDTIKPPFARSSDPRTSDVGPQYTWNRDELFGSGALNVAELLERVPGTTSFRTGWVNSQKFVAVNGQLDAVRVFYDGLELDNMSARSAPLLDLNTIQLWTLESVAIERLGGELRVYLRSWQAARTVPSTRVDVMTGDEDTNIYRGFYGKRFRNGAGLQFAGQQFNTTSARFGGGGDGLSVMARVGTGGRMWSVDAFANRTQGTRVLQPTFGAGLSIPAYSATQSLAYARFALGQAKNGPWLELIAAARRLNEDSRHVLPASAPQLHVIADTVDTVTTMKQYVVSAGFTRGPLQIVGVDRIRGFSGSTTHALGGRLQFDSRFVFGEVSAEHDDFAKRNRTDAVARITPTPFITASAAVSRVTSTLDRSLILCNENGCDPDVISARVEGGIRLLGPWLIAGFLTRDTALLQPPRAFDTAYVTEPVGRRSGAYVGIRGTIYGALGADIVATQWAAADSYRPSFQARSEINLITRWLSRFPSGNFGIHAALIHEYRGQVRFPVANAVRVTESSSNVFHGLLEIRILKAVISYQIRNLAGELHQIVPDFYMPRVINLYGVRWEFLN
jgi:hypothetical protein